VDYYQRFSERLSIVFDNINTREKSYAILNENTSYNDVKFSLMFGYSLDL